MYLHTRFPNIGYVLKGNTYKWGSDDDYTYSQVQARTGQAPTPWNQGNQQMTVDHYIHYDGLLVIINGIANTRF